MSFHPDLLTLFSLLFANQNKHRPQYLHALISWASSCFFLRHGSILQVFICIGAPIRKTCTKTNCFYASFIEHEHILSFCYLFWSVNANLRNFSLADFFFLRIGLKQSKLSTNMFPLVTAVSKISVFPSKRALCVEGSKWEWTLMVYHEDGFMIIMSLSKRHLRDAKSCLILLKVLL